MAKADENLVPIQVSVKLHDAPQGQRPSQAAAYAFKASGRLLATTAVDREGKAVLNVPTARVPQDIRVLVGPLLEEHEVNLADLSRHGASQQFVRFGGKSHELRVDFQIPSEVGSVGFVCASFAAYC